jgi:hypothetical protein
MRTRPFYFASNILILCALCFHFSARDKISQGQHLKAQSIAAAIDHGSAVQNSSSAIEASNKGRRLNAIGSWLIGFGIIFLVVAIFRRESAWYSLPAIFIFLDVILIKLL